MLILFVDFAECKSTEYKCDNKQCIPSYRVCDAMVDCLDGSDERLCGKCIVILIYAF